MFQLTSAEEVSALWGGESEETVHKCWYWFSNGNLGANTATLKKKKEVLVVVFGFVLFLVSWVGFFGFVLLRVFCFVFFFAFGGRGFFCRVFGFLLLLFWVFVCFLVGFGVCLLFVWGFFSS